MVATADPASPLLRELTAPSSDEVPTSRGGFPRNSALRLHRQASKRCVLGERLRPPLQGLADAVLDTRCVAGALFGRVHCRKERHLRPAARLRVRVVPSSVIMIMHRTTQAIVSSLRALVRQQRQIEVGQPATSLFDRLPLQRPSIFIKVSPREGHPVLTRRALHNPPRASPRLQIQVGVQDRVAPEVRGPRILYAHTELALLLMMRT